MGGGGGGLLKTPNLWDVRLSVCAHGFRYFERGRNAFIVRVRQSKWILSAPPSCEDEATSVLRNVKKCQTQLYVPEGLTLHCASCREVREACALGRYCNEEVKLLFVINEILVL